MIVASWVARSYGFHVVVELFSNLNVLAIGVLCGIYFTLKENMSKKVGDAIVRQYSDVEIAGAAGAGNWRASMGGNADDAQEVLVVTVDDGLYAYRALVDAASGEVRLVRNTGDTRLTKYTARFGEVPEPAALK